MSQHSGAIRTYLESNALIRLVESVDDDMLYLLQQVATGAVRAVTSEVAECTIFLSSDLRLRLPQTLTRLRLDQIRGNP